MAQGGDGAGRGSWATRVGFVLAAAGSAIGLGNIWKFPYITGVNGGGAFVLVYIACILVVGLPIMFAELVIGKHTHRNPVGAFRKMAAGSRRPWWLVGVLGVASGLCILSFYAVVAGWALDYFIMAIRGAFVGTDEEIAGLFGDLASSPLRCVFWQTIFMVFTIAIVAGGVRKGIESWNKILMPVLFLLLLVLMVNSLLNDGGAEGFRFLFAADFSKITPKAALEAMGHAFFTLSLGMGAMITYGSYLGEKADISRDALIITFLDTLIALMAGLVIFPIVFRYGLEPGAGPSLIFKTLPVLFAKMPAGRLVATAFFLLLSFAALTSAISLLEVVVAWGVDERGWGRKKAALVLGGVVWLLGLPSANLAYEVPLFGMSFLDIMDALTTNYMLPLGGLFIALYVGWIMPVETKAAEFHHPHGPVHRAWRFIIRYVTPVAVVAVMLYKMGVIKLR